MAGDFALQWVDKEGRRVVVEDDGRTGYAYLILPCELIGAHVWLYNRQNPIEAEDQSVPKNPEDSIAEQPFPDPGEDDFEVVFSPTTRQVAIYVHGQLHAILSEYSPVGWCQSSLRPNNVALPLDLENSPPLVTERRERMFLSWELGDSTLILESDPRAAYAYLYRGDERLCSVWLWNNPEPNPDYADRPDETGNRAPNPASAEFELPASEEDVTVMQAKGAEVALLYVRRSLHAILDPSNPIGMCMIATETNELARRMPTG